MSPAAQTILALAAPVAFALMAGITARLLLKASAYFHAKEQAEKDGTLKDRTFAVMAVLTQCAADAVQVTESKIRPELKAAGADGKISADDAKMLRDMAVAIAKEQARLAAPKLLAAAGLDDLDGLLEHLVEGAAAKLAGDSRGALATPALAAAAAAVPAPGAGLAVP